MARRPPFGQLMSLIPWGGKFRYVSDPAHAFVLVQDMRPMRLVHVWGA